MFNGVLLVAIIATWILKVTSLLKLYKLFSRDSTNNFIIFVARYSIVTNCKIFGKT